MSEWLELARRCEQATRSESGFTQDQRPVEWAIYKAAFAGAEGFSGNERNFPRYTASIDAITALIERKLPKYHWRVQGGNPDTGLAAMSGLPRAYMKRSRLGIGQGLETASTPALALCAAFCRAMAVEEGWSGDDDDLAILPAR